jgi:hypothetical protein
MKNRLFILIFTFFQIMPLHSQEKTDSITSIEIIGLKRTKPHVARYPLEKFLGQDRREFDQNEVFAEIKDMGVLEPVSAELVETDNGLILKVTVEEKWSIFPFPFMIVGSGASSYGLFLVDFNAFGIRDNIVLGGIYGSDGWNVIAMYNHTPASRMPGWFASFMYSRHEKEDVDKEEIIYRRYSADRLQASLGLNYSFTDIFTGNFTVAFSDISLNDGKGTPFNPPEDGIRLLRFSPGLSLRDTSWDGFLLSQKSLSLEYGYNLALHGSSFHQVVLRGIIEHSLVPGFRINLKSAGVWKSGTDPLCETGPQSVLVNILPREFSARHYAGFSAGLEKYIYKAKWGTLAVQGSWQAVFSRSLLPDFEFNHGPAGGILFYLSRVALPAVGGGLAYNMKTGLYQGVFSIGMAF